MNVGIQLLLTMLAGWMSRRQQAVIEYLQEENRILREHAGKGTRLRFTNEQRSRLARKGKKLGWAGLKEASSLVTPQTIMRWLRELIAKKYDGSQARKKPRKRDRDELRATVLRMAQENATWGYRRIEGGLKDLGIEVSYITVRNILKKSGFEPAPLRHELSNWNQFMRSHLEIMGAMDFFSVEVWTPKGLVRYCVHFVIHLESRRVEITRIGAQWDGEIMKQVARNMTDCVDGCLSELRYVIMDKDPLYTKEFREMLRDSGLTILRLPPQSPYLNGYAERFVQSIKSECLDRLIFVGESSLRRAVKEYMTHYHAERPHQSLGNQLIDFPAERAREGPIEVRERLGGVLKHYYRRAA